MTIIYYTSNRENEDFERKIRLNILNNSDLPIVSVSQKKIDFGRNICVGDVGTSGFNVLRQILIACENCDTEYVICTEADCLYPPDYFTFKPNGKDVYRNTNTYLMGHNRDCYWKKNEGGLWSQIVKREFYIKRLKEIFKDEPMWDETKKNFPKEKKMKLFENYETYKTENSCISFKTGKSMRHYSHSERTPIYELPYWGNSKLLRTKYDPVLHA
jgi:hypothetical protein